MHWLPTQERKYLPLQGSSIPKNLIIRLSNAKNDTKPGNAWDHWSTVVTKPARVTCARRLSKATPAAAVARAGPKDVKEVQYKIH